MDATNTKQPDEPAGTRTPAGSRSLVEPPAGADLILVNWTWPGTTREGKFLAVLKEDGTAYILRKVEDSEVPTLNLDAYNERVRQWRMRQQSKPAPTTPTPKTTTTSGRPRPSSMFNQ